MPVSAVPRCMTASGPQIVPLVELFTSEGCDSCPDADRWLTLHFPVTKAPRTTTVLAFHVDYWDRLGWKDRFATAQFTQRQYDAMRVSGATFVYTPQVLVQGRDPRSWQTGGVPALLDNARRRSARASITMEIAAEAAGVHAIHARASVPDQASRKNAVLWLAYTESRLASDVKSGENRGVRLTHDHVVRALKGPYPSDAEGGISARESVARPAEAGRSPTFAAVVQDRMTGDVLQTLTMPACGGGP